MTLHHICFISQEYPPDTGWGGIGSYTYEMAHALVNTGYRVTVIARAIVQEGLTDDNGVAVHRVLPSPTWERFRGLWRVNHFWPGFAWSAMIRLREIHRQTPISVIEAPECRADGFFLRWWKRRPSLIIRLHTAWIFVDRLNAIVPDNKKRFKYWLEQSIIQNADVITAPCQAMVDLTESWVSLSQKNVYIVPNPVCSTSVIVPELRRRAEVLFVGRLEKRKGIETLAIALPYVLRQCSEATFRFIGSDELDQNGQSWQQRITENLTSSERKRVIFEQLSRDALATRYQTAAICVMPSIWENFPYAVLEAMTYKLPIVATETGGLAEIVKNGHTGLLVPPEEPLALTKALCELLNDPVKCEEYGRNARNRIEDLYATDRIVPEMIKVYKSLVPEEGVK